MRRSELRPTLGLIAAALLGLFVALMSWTREGQAPYPAAPGDDGVTIHLLDNGFHSDLAISRRDLARGGGRLKAALDRTGPGDWVLVGWGDARFYVDQSPIHHRLPDGARAFFASGNPSVVMLDPYQGDPARLGPDEKRRSLTLSTEGFAALRARLEASLALSDGAPRVAAARPGDDVRFFASRETFSLVHLCNHWTAQVLAAGGVGVRPVRSVLSAEVVDAARVAALDTGGRGD